MADEGGDSAGTGGNEGPLPGHVPDVEDPEGPRDGRAGAAPGTHDREFGRRGWVLVAAIVVAFVVVPALLYFLPRASGLAASLGLSMRDAYLVLPLVPALVLAALAVWATTRP